MSRSQYPHIWVMYISSANIYYPIQVSPCERQDLPGRLCELKNHDVSIFCLFACNFHLHWGGLIPCTYSAPTQAKYLRQVVCDGINMNSNVKSKISSITGTYVPLNESAFELWQVDARMKPSKLNKTQQDVHNKPLFLFATGTLDGKVKRVTQTFLKTAGMTTRSSQDVHSPLASNWKTVAQLLVGQNDPVKIPWHCAIDDNRILNSNSNNYSHTRKPITRNQVSKPPNNHNSTTKMSIATQIKVLEDMKVSALGP